MVWLPTSRDPSAGRRSTPYSFGAAMRLIGFTTQSRRSIARAGGSSGISTGYSLLRGSATGRREGSVTVCDEDSVCDIADAQNHRHRRIS